MIKPVKLINTITDIAQTAADKAGKVISQGTDEATDLVKADGELLQAYRGVKTKKLFASFDQFLESFKQKLATFKDEIPEDLFKKLNELSSSHDFSLSKTVSEYYSGLKNCKTLDDVKKLYPEIELPKLNFEEEIASDIRSIVPKSLCDEIAKLKTKEEKTQRINKYFEESISKQVEKWEIYPELKKLQQQVSEEIVNGKYTGNPLAQENYNYRLYNSKMPLRYRLMHTPNREEAIISMLKEHYIDGKSMGDIIVKTTDGKEIVARRLKNNCDLGELDKNFRSFIKSSEHTASEFQKLSDLTTHEINSAVMTQTWRTSRLRADLGNETAYKKDWSLVKSVWHKTMFPETSYFPTDKLIDVYLVNLFKSGKVVGGGTNPLAKHLKNPQMDKTKIMLLKRLYKGTKLLESDKNIINSKAFQEFKASLDVDGMKKTLEAIEEHYKNAFFKRFWTDERKLRFSQALHQNRELANKNIEISDSILTDAMNSVFREID